MIDISSIDKYIQNPDSCLISFIESEIKRIGVLNYIEECFTSLDCSRVSKDNIRLMQTIGYPYMREITKLVYVVNNYAGETHADDIYTRLLELHQKNLEYEQLNPPVWYGGEKAKRKFERTYKVDKIKTPKTKKEKPKQTAAERKLAAKVAKINALSIKLKPVN